MGAQSHIEKVLRDIHVLLSECEVYDKENNLVIINKKTLVESLQELSQGIYEVMDEHELTKRSREQAEREIKKRGDSIIQDASRKAEDVYAGSVMYTDEALKRTHIIMQDAKEAMQEAFERMNQELEREMQRVRTDQTALIGYLQDLTDTNKYMQIIEERNRKLAKEQVDGKEEEAAPAIAAPKPEIRINEAYFREHGFSLEEEEEIPEEKIEKVTAEVSVNLDSEYFKWKAQEETGEAGASGEKKPAKRSLFDKIKSKNN